MFIHELGKTAKDKITGFKGIIVGRCEHIFGCNTYGIAPQILSEKGERRETEWFDEARIEILKGKTISPKPVAERKNGGEYTEHP